MWTARRRKGQTDYGRSAAEEGVTIPPPPRRMKRNKHERNQYMIVAIESPQNAVVSRMLGPDHGLTDYPFEI